MAIAIRSGTTNTQTATGPATVTFTMSSAPQAGDLVICALNVRSTSSGSFGAITAPHSMVQTATRNNGTYARGCIYAVLATGSEGTSWAFDFEQYEFSPQQVTGVIFALSGVHATDPITGTPGQNTDSTSDTNFVVSSITTSYANSWAIAIAVSCGDSFPGAAPSTWSNSFTGIGSSAGAGTRATIGVGYKLISSPGAVGDATASYTGSSDTSLGFMLEVREAASTVKKLKLLAHPSSSSAGSALGVSYGRGN